MEHQTTLIRELAFIPDQTIEKRAYSLLSSFESQYGRIASPPIPIEKIIECYLDLWIDWDEIDDTVEEKILGYIDPSTKKIRLNTRHLSHFEEYIGTEAYTKAHEVGHWDLHVAKAGDSVQLAFPYMLESQCYLCRQKRGDSREIQAERYAAYLLMPHHLLMTVMEGRDITRWPTLYDLKDQFGVTISALKNRLVGLGLIFVSPDGKIFHSEAEYKGNLSFF
jgi:Zn-dependent peptidase ImmA (M78 family)